MKLAAKLQAKQSIAKGVILVALTVAGSISSQSAFANFLFSKTPSKGGPVILTSTTITPGNQPLPFTSIVGLAGPTCGDLKEVERVTTGKILPGVLTTTSEDIVSEETSDNQKPGSWGCERVDVVYKNKTYSSGNIQLLWDGKEYIAANPSAFTVDFTK